MFTFLESGGMKMQMGVSFEIDEESTDNETPFTIEATGNTKEISGYSCKEYKLTGEDMTGTAWVTTETDIRFPSSYYNSSNTNNSNQEWMTDLDGWVMLMEMTDTSKRKPSTMVMECLTIEKSNFKIKSSDYPKIGG